MEKLTDKQKISLVSFALIGNKVTGADMSSEPIPEVLIKCGHIWTNREYSDGFEPFEFLLTSSGLAIVLNFVDPTGKSDLCKLLKAMHE